MIAFLFKKRSLGLILVLGSLVSGTAFAGNEGSGGGGAIVLSDDRVVLADPYFVGKGQQGAFHCQQGESGELNSLLVQELKRAGQVLVRYGAEASNLPWSNTLFSEPGPEQSRFVSEQVLQGQAFCFVDELPKRQDNPVECDQFTAPVGGHCEPVGYTEGTVTWIRKDLFQRMSVRDQAVLLIHERLHGFAGNVPYGPIVELTSGLETALGILNDQLQGKRPILEDQAINAIRKMVRRLVDLKLGNPYFASTDYFDVSKNGGGLVSKHSTVSPTAYIGVGSFVPARAEIGDGSTLINSDLCSFVDSNQFGRPRAGMGWGAPGYRIGKGVQLHNSWIGYAQHVVIGDGARIENSRIAIRHDAPEMTDGFFALGVNAVIKDSEIFGARDLKQADRSRIENVHVMFSSFGTPKTPTDVELGADATFSNLALSTVWNAWGEPQRAFGGKLYFESTLRIAPGKTVDFAGEGICGPANDQIKVVGDRTAESAGQIRHLCKKRR